MTIGIIGCGKQAPKHISGLLDREDVSCIFVSDINETQSESLSERYDEHVSMCSIDDIFQNEKIRGVIISTPTAVHYSLCEKALKSGKPFLVEKPLAGSLRDAQKVLELSRETNIPGMVGYIYRSSPTFDHFSNILANKAIYGKPYQAFFRIAGRGAHQEWKHRKDMNGGAISEMMVHMIDLAVWFFGPAKTIKLLEKELLQPMREINGKAVACDAEDYALAQMLMADGTNVLIQADMVSPAFKQYAEINTQYCILEGSIQANYPTSLTFNKATGGFKQGQTILDIPKANLYLSQGDVFMDMVNSLKTPTKGSLEDAVEVMRIEEELKSQI